MRANQNDLPDNDNWDSLFSVLQFLKLSDEYTLDDYRSKGSTNNILRLYAREVSMNRPDEKEFKKYYAKHGIEAFFKTIFDEIKRKKDIVVEEEEPVGLPEKIEPESVVTLDFTPEAIWEAYLLKTTDYYIGHRWHGGYHKMTIPANIDELKKFKPWKEDEIPKYEKFIQETELDFDPKITIKGNLATIEHIAVFFHNRFSKCTAKAYYNAVDKKIEKFEFDNVDIFKFSQRFYF